MLLLLLLLAGHNDTPIRGGSSYYAAFANFLFDAAEKQELLAQLDHKKEGRQDTSASASSGRSPCQYRYAPFILQQAVAQLSERKDRSEQEDAHSGGQVLYDGVYGR